MRIAICAPAGRNATGEGPSPPLPVATTLRRGLQVHQCLGFSGHGERVFAAEIGLVPLAALMGPTE